MRENKLHVLRIARRFPMLTLVDSRMPEYPQYCAVVDFKMNKLFYNTASADDANLYILTFR